MIARKHASRADRELVIDRVFDAPRKLVFEMWSKGEHINRWCCPKGFTLEAGGGDFRPGGAWRQHMRSPDGQDFRLQGIYREIVENERIAFTHAWLDERGRPGHETLVTVTFADYGRMTKLTLHQAMFDSKASRDGHEGGWSECLNGLAAYLARGKQA